VRGLLTLLLAATMTSGALGSAVLEYLVTAQILKAEIRQGKTYADFRVVHSPRLKPGRIFQNVPLDQEVEVGQIVRLKYRSYSAMGPNGPVSSETWTVQ